MEYPDFIARFYDIIYDKVRTGVDNEYFLEKTCSASGKVLEVGVGTGRLFLDALAKEADVYGIDISPSMITVLKNKLDQHNKHRVWVEDGAKMNIDMKFNLIIAPFRMFSHLIEIQEQLNFLNNVSNHLEPDGQFIFDLYVPNMNILIEGFNNYKDFEEEYKPGRKLKRYITTKTDLIEQITDVTMKLCWEEDDGEMTEEWKFPMRYFFRYEIEHLIALSNLQLVTIYGDHKENRLSNESTDFVMVCEKRKQE